MRKNNNILVRGINSIKGDKVIFIVTILLMLFSILVIFGSSSSLAVSVRTNRLEIAKQHAITVLIGALLMMIIYKWRFPKFIKFISRYGFLISLVLLLILFLRLNLGFVRAASINSSYRILMIGGFQVHIYEYIKVLMIMYTAWALNNQDKGKGFFLQDLLKKKIPWICNPWVSCLIYIFLPIIIVAFLVQDGSNTSAILIGSVLLLMPLIGKRDHSQNPSPRISKYLMLAGALLVVCVYFVAKDLGKEDSVISPQLKEKLLSIRKVRVIVERLHTFDIEDMYRAKDTGNTELYNKIKTYIQQPLSAKIAIKEGGLFAKGPGGSSQQYIVPLMYSDYAFSFILEEYGIFGCIAVLLLFFTLFARGGMVVRELDGIFEKNMVGGLIILIGFQAYIHMMVNVDLMALTGQTLPLLSHGANAFMAFSAAFGLILYYSRLAKENIAREERNYEKEHERTDSQENK